MTHVRHIDAPRPQLEGRYPPDGLPSRSDSRLPIRDTYRSERRRCLVKRYRRLMVSLGWLAAFLMAAGAGWKSS